MINIKRKKFFIIGKEELEKRMKGVFLNKSNPEIFYVSDFFCPSNYFKFLSIKPILDFDKNDMKNIDIRINDSKGKSPK